jgi:hypothetical protein
LNLRKLGLRTAILGVDTIHQGDRCVVAKSSRSKDISVQNGSLGRWESNGTPTEILSVQPVTP